jgi:hypothetical protein
MAAHKVRLSILHELCEWAKEVLTQDVLNNEMLLVKDNMERTAWNMAAKVGIS